MSEPVLGWAPQEDGRRLGVRCEEPQRLGATAVMGGFRRRFRRQPHKAVAPSLRGDSCGALEGFGDG